MSSNGTSLDDAALQIELVAILTDLIALRSDYPPGDTHAICNYAAERLTRAGYEVSIHTDVEPFANVVARRGSGEPRIVFNAHADTVAVDEPDAWRSDPLQAEVRNGRLYGLGAANCKASMAVQIWLAEHLAASGEPGDAGELVFTFVADEEALGPNGMGYLRRAGLVEPDVLLYGATTDNQLIITERGVLQLRITAFGRTAHAGDPSAGDNAIERMMRLLAVLNSELGTRLAERRRGEMASTSNTGLIRGGHNTNAVPSRCSVEIDRRLLPDEDTEAAFEEIKAILASAGEPTDSYAAEALLGSNGFEVRSDSRAVNAFRAAIEARTGEPAIFCNAMGVSDARHFAADGIEIVGFGPGAGSEGHAANESVAVSQLVDAALICRDVVHRLLRER